jgi:hypothetical protein
MKTSSDVAAPRIPSKYVDWARERDIVVIAGANQAVKYWRRIRSGLGTAARPFRGTQSLDAAIALAALSGRDDRTFYACGYGPAVDPSETISIRTQLAVRIACAFSRVRVWPMRSTTRRAWPTRQREG